jgi:hypothetical protein
MELELDIETERWNSRYTGVLGYDIGPSPVVMVGNFLMLIAL